MTTDQLIEELQRYPGATVKLVSRWGTPVDVFRLKYARATAREVLD